MKYSNTNNLDFIQWQPSTWSDFHNFNEASTIIRRIFQETIIEEIDNVIKDATHNNGSIEHRGHIIAIAQLCATDTLSSYSYFDDEAKVCENCGRSDSKIKKYSKFIKDFFPDEYKEFSNDLYKLYRNSMVHSWNLFEVGILLDNTAPIKNNGNLIFGLLNFQSALKKSVKNFFDKLKTDSNLQKNTLGRYKELQKTAKL